MEQLENLYLPRVSQYRFCQIMIENLPKLREEIKEISMSDLKDFLESIRKHSDRIGETAMKQVSQLNRMAWVLLFTESFSFISVKLRRRFVQRLQSSHRPLSKDGELWNVNMLCGFYQCPGKKYFLLREREEWCCVSQVSRNYEVPWVVSSWIVCVSAATAPKQRAAYLASWPGWIRQKRCWDNCLVLSKVLLLQKTKVRAGRRLRQLEAFLAPSQNNLPLQTTTTRQGLKQLMRLKFIWKANAVFVWLLIDRIQVGLPFCHLRFLQNPALIIINWI